MEGPFYGLRPLSCNMLLNSEPHSNSAFYLVKADDGCSNGNIDNFCAPRNKQQDLKPCNSCEVHLVLL